MEKDALIIPGCWALQDLQPFIEDFGDDSIKNDLIATHHHSNNMISSRFMFKSMSASRLLKLDI